MIRSSMFTYGFRLYAGFAAVALVGAFIAAVSYNAINTDQGVIDAVVGPISMGWKGGVGSHLTYTVLLMTTATAGAIAGFLVAFRDADPEAQMQVVQTESVPLTRAPRGSSFAPLTSAFGAVAVVVGVAAGSPLWWVGVAALVAAGFIWLVRTWSNRATGDDLTNAELYYRIMDPLRLPVVSLLLIGFVVIGMSRILLAVSEIGAVVVFSIVGALFFAGAAYVASQPAIPRRVIAVLVVVGAVLVLALAVAGVIAGEREFPDYSRHAPATAPVVHPEVAGGAGTGAPEVPR